MYNIIKSLRTMIIKNKKVNVYDIEIFPNCFHCTVKDTEKNILHKFEISERKNQLLELIDYFYYNSSDILFCGYNNKHYDDVIINYIIDYGYKLKTLNYIRICQSLYGLSSTIVNSEEGDTSKFKKWKYANYFYSMDLLTMLFSSKLRVGLKEMQVTMHYKNVQEFSGDFNQWLKKEEIDEMIEYNINDVESTSTLLEKCRADIDIRLFIEEEYKIDALSMDSVKFGETILLNEYCKKTGLNKSYVKELRSQADTVDLQEVILPFIKYKNPELQAVLIDMKKQIVSTKERKGYEKKFVLSNTVFSVGVGGIHSLNKPKIFRPSMDEFIGHADVMSMYPSFIIEYGWIPRHLRKEFLQIYSNFYTDRITAKHSGQMIKSTALKLTLNSVTGKMQQETSWMYDPLSVFKIRINGQLILLMLVDRLLELGCKIVQVNTDGVMYISPKKQSNRIQEAIAEVEKITRLNFEVDRYEAFYQYAVNDYFGVVEGYSQSGDPKLIEKKGMFITANKLGKGLAPVIIPKAVINYFLTKQPIPEYIKNSKDIKDFLMTQRVNKKFKVEYGDEPIQRINRYYASTNGRYLYKVNTENGSAGYTNMLKDSGVTILNTFDDAPIDARKINYNYYIGEAEKIVNSFVHQQLELFE